MPWRRFLAFNAVGAALWVALWATLGYLAGDHITAIYRTLSRCQWYILGVLALLDKDVKDKAR